ncbi:MAG: response regulator transcription factor [Actinobacteria bacterium]|nr:MAG: response regulator transcription factor [Actinomycetota bacterium]
MSARRVLIASADRLFADAVSSLVDGRPGWKAVGAVADGIAAVAEAARLRPDAVLMTTELRRLDAASAARQVRRRLPEATVVIVGGAGPSGGPVMPLGASAEDVFAALAAAPGAVAGGSADAGEGMSLLQKLTTRERRVLRMLAEGRSMKDIARHLDVSEHTIRTHMQNLYAKLGCHSRVDIVNFATRHGVVRLAGDEPSR